AIDTPLNATRPASAATASRAGASSVGTGKSPRLAAPKTAAPSVTAAPPTHTTLPSPDEPPKNTAAAVTPAVANTITACARRAARTGRLGSAPSTRGTRSTGSGQDTAREEGGWRGSESHKSFTLGPPTAYRQPRGCPELVGHSCHATVQ